tara:strand:- start:430 stop:654 length:225 start_codon:yes stop_codon:yes gene_type:complete
MEKLPTEIKHEIMEYLYTCKKEKNFILDKETLKIYKNLTYNCEPVEVLKKTLCKKCDRKAIIYVRMIMNNLLPG